jgi:hypothetical protein
MATCCRLGRFQQQESQQRIPLLAAASKPLFADAGLFPVNVFFGEAGSKSSVHMTEMGH